MNKRPESRWVLKTQNDETVESFADYLDDYYAAISKKPSKSSAEEKREYFILMSRLFYNRGFREIAQIDSFFNTSSSSFYDPFLLPDMDKAVDRINKAIADNEKITVYGDYDVDGITSVSVLYRYLSACGANVDYYIPARTEEGYGLNENALLKIYESGTSLLITVDTGTTAVNEVEYGKSIGLDIVITDHHECKVIMNNDGSYEELIPDAVAVVNPKRPSGQYPFSELAGVGVVFKLLCALTGDTEKILNQYGDLVAIGTIADIMPLINENRTIVVIGMKNMKAHMPVGLKALLTASGNEKEISSSVVAYNIAPRLNAAGRIGDPKISINLLLENDYAQANSLAFTLCEENRRRQQLELSILSDVEKMISECQSDDKILVFASDDWHHGVIGIVASRIVEKYGRPCILLCGDGENMKGSARSVKGVNIFELLQNNSSVLLKYGGHEMAAGLSLSRSRYNEFRDSIIEYANKKITDKMLVPVIEAECELPFVKLTLQTYDVLKLLEPYGTGNPTPLFIVKNLKVCDIEPIGNGHHVKMRVSSTEASSDPVTMLLFNKNYSGINCVAGDEIDVVCSLYDNIFNGKRSLSVHIKKFRLSNTIESNDKVSKLFYDNFKKNKKVIDDISLTRDHVIAVFRKIRKQPSEIEEYQPYALSRAISYEFNPEINYARTMLSLDILQELGLLKYSGSELIKINYKHTFEKVDLQNSQTWSDVHKQ
ncbi:MAG: single-stranded-DNA-specific exonuclease RecJ [Clostridia bacterium]|nr:single-stranded-DNA-specific exonuclease RecJ [Clostridia bacterium]